MAQRSPRIWTAYGVFFLGIMVAAIASQLAARNLPASTTFASPWAMAIIGALVGSLIMWCLIGLLVMLLSGTGSRSFEIAGWSGAAMLTAGLALLVLAAFFPIHGSVPPVPTDAKQLADWMKQYQYVVQHSTYGRFSRWFSLLGMLWGAWIIYGGVLVFNRARAALTAGMYAGLELIFFFMGALRLGR